MKDIHGFERAEFEPEIGVVEIDPGDTGEIPVVVINTEQPHKSAIAALRAWRARIAVPLPLLAAVDLIKENPIGAITGALATAAVTTGSLVITLSTVIPGGPPGADDALNERTLRPVVAVTHAITPRASPRPRPRVPMPQNVEATPKRPRAVRPSPAPTPEPIRRPARAPASPRPPSITLRPGPAPADSAAPRLPGDFRHEPAHQAPCPGASPIRCPMG